MRSLILCGAAAGFALASWGSLADDAGGKPTTSPNNGREGTLIQNIGFPDDSGGSLIVLKKDKSAYAKSRAALHAAVVEFNALSRQFAKEEGKSKLVLGKLEKAVKSVDANVRAIIGLAKASKAGAKFEQNAVAAAYIPFKGIEGRQGVTEVQAVAKRLTELEAQLGLLEPVVHR